MSGKSHRPESKEAISKTQKARYNLLRMAVEKATNEDRIREVVKEEIQKLINESKPVNNKHNNIPL